MIALRQPLDGAPPLAGSSATLYLPAQRCLLFNAAGRALPRA